MEDISRGIDHQGTYFDSGVLESLTTSIFFPDRARMKVSYRYSKDDPGKSYTLSTTFATDKNDSGIENISVIVW